jgi:hypothetical protein
LRADLIVVEPRACSIVTGKASVAAAERSVKPRSPASSSSPQPATSMVRSSSVVRSGREEDGIVRAT